MGKAFPVFRFQFQALSDEDVSLPKGLLWHVVGLKLAEGHDFVQLLASMPDVNLHTIGRVLQPAGAVLYRVSLPNGKVILAHLSKSLMQQGAVFEENDRLVLEMTPYDFEQARIIRLEKTASQKPLEVAAVPPLY